MGQARGIIKLSRQQAGGRRIEIAALCLKYISCFAAMVILFALWLRNYDTPGDMVYILGAVIFFVMSVYFKIKLHYTTYQISEQYLRRAQDLVTAAPTNVQLFGFGITLLSAKCAVISLMLLPSVLCLKYGLYSFALSGERKQLMLMIGASLCLLSGGIIFASVIVAHFYCAEYLFFSGNSTSAFAALEKSWLITSGCCGDCIMLELFLGFRGIFISSLSRLNLSKKLTQAFLDNRYADDLYFELRRVSLKDDIFVILEGLM